MKPDIKILDLLDEIVTHSEARGYWEGRLRSYQYPSKNWQMCMENIDTAGLASLKARTELKILVGFDIPTLTPITE